MPKRPARSGAAPARWRWRPPVDPMPSPPRQSLHDPHAWPHAGEHPVAMQTPRSPRVGRKHVKTHVSLRSRVRVSGQQSRIEPGDEHSMPAPPIRRSRRVPVMKHAFRPLAALLAAVIVASPAAATPITWKVDQAHTEVGFEVRHFFSKVHGVFHDMQGTIVFDEQNPSAIQVDATARVSSVDTGNKNRDADLQTPDFFNAEKDSILSFKSTKVEKAGK